MVVLKNCEPELSYMLAQGSYGLESQERKYLLQKGSWKVRELENFCIKSQGKSGKKIPVENEVSRSTFGFQNCFP